MIENFKFLREIYINKDEILYKAVEIETGKEYLIKKLSYPSTELYEEILRNKNGNKEKTDQYFFNKINSFIDEFWKFSNINNSLENTVKYLDIEVTKNTISSKTYNIFFLAESLEPINFFLEYNPLTLNDFFKISFDIITAISSFHNQGIILGDLNLSKIFINKENNFLIDNPYFNVLLDPKNFNNENRFYTVPEFYYSNEEIKENSDTFLLGVTLYELLNLGVKPFLDNETKTHGNFEVNNTISKLRNSKILSFPKDVDEDLKNIITKTLNIKNERYTSIDNLKNELEIIKDSKNLNQLNYDLNSPKSVNDKIAKNIQSSKSYKSSNFKKSEIKDNLSSGTLVSNSGSKSNSLNKGFFLLIILASILSFSYLFFINYYNKPLDQNTINNYDNSLDLITLLDENTIDSSLFIEYELTPYENGNSFINNSRAIIVYTESKLSNIINKVEIVDLTNYTIANLKYGMNYDEALEIFSSAFKYYYKTKSTLGDSYTAYTGPYKNKNDIKITVTFDEQLIIKNITASYNPK